MGLFKLRGSLASLRHVGVAPLKHVAHEQFTIRAFAYDISDSAAVFLLEGNAAGCVVYYGVWG